MTAKAYQKELRVYATPDKAKSSAWFFKTGKGQYGEGDVFIGVTVPDIRSVCKRFKTLPLTEIQKLLHSPVHEDRLGAVLLLAARFKTERPQVQEKIYALYLQNVRDGHINNWDIIDTSTGYVVGEYLLHRPRDILYELARSEKIWEKRVAMISTLRFIVAGDASTTIEIAEILLYDTHDLIQKAVGWMLREVGKRVDPDLLITFLNNHAHEMPRTMLRYAIERLPDSQRKQYLAQKKRRQNHNSFSVRSTYT